MSGLTAEACARFADGAGGATQRMQKGKLLVLAVFVAVVGTIVAFRMTDVPEQQSGAAPGVRERPVIPTSPREFLGVALQLLSGSEDHPYEQYIREIAQSGANTIAMVVRAHQENASSTSIFIDVRTAPSDKRLAEVIRFAREGDPHKGRQPLKVVLMPIVLLENARAGEWRGKIAPEKWEDWWEDYSKYILHYARIAQDTGVEVLMVGSELVSTEQTQAHRWRKLIADVRGVFKGRLGYSANWDHYRPIKWWNDLDIIGMTSYYDLTGGKQPTLDVLRKAWGPIKKDILAWRDAQHPNHPILFTEVGWPNQVTCAQYPWDYYRSEDKPDPEAQANCFEAFFETWMNEPAVAGYLVWEWRSYPGQQVGPKDTSYVPCGKPAEEVISHHFRAARMQQATTAPAGNRDTATTQDAGAPLSDP